MSRSLLRRSVFRRLALCLGVLASVGAMWSSAPSAPAQHIVAVSWTSIDQLSSLGSLRYLAPGVAIIDATPETTRQLADAGVEILFEDQTGAEQGWFLADHLHGDRRPEGVHLVYEDPHGWALLRLATAQVTAHLGDEHFLYPLPEHYATPTQASTPGLRAASREPSAAVAQLVDGVDPDRLRATVERLSFIDPALGAVSGNVRSRYARRRETFASTTYLRQQLAAELGEDAVRLDSFRIASDDSIMYNVVGELAGTDPDAGTYIICAHYDAIGSRSSRADLARVGAVPGRWDWLTHPAPGADDNGSGVAVVLESARILASAQPFPWSIRFIAWSGEELGLWGSRHYADAARARGDHILGVLNFDMVGFNDLRDRVELVSNPSSLWLVDLLRATNERYALGLQIDVLEDRFAGLSDHQPFWANGYDAILGIENYLPTDADAPSVLQGEYRINSQYHSVVDLPDSINWELVARITRLTVAALAQFGTETGLPNLAVFEGDLRGDGADDLQVRVANLGPVALTQSFDLRVSLCAADSAACSVIFTDTHTGGVEAGGVASFHIPWQRYGNSVFLIEVDPDNRIAEEVDIDDNRAFQQVRLVPTTGVVIFPNPYRPSSDPVLRFSGVPLFSRLRLFGLDGQQVWRGLEEDQGQTSHEILWTGVTTAGFAASPGIYIYDLRTFEGDLVERGKVAVVR
jgi:hypothetical protein